MDKMMTPSDGHHQESALSLQTKNSLRKMSFLNILSTQTIRLSLDKYLFLNSAEHVQLSQNP